MRTLYFISVAFYAFYIHVIRRQKQMDKKLHLGYMNL